MAKARKVAGEWQEVTGDFTVRQVIVPPPIEGQDEEGNPTVEQPPAYEDEINYPFSALFTLTDEELAGFGIEEIVEAPPVPEDVKFIGTRLIDFNGDPRRENIVEQYTPAEAVAIMWERAKAYREVVILKGAATPLGVVDADVDAKANILGVAVGWIISQMVKVPFHQTFTMHDDSQVELNDENTAPFALSAGAYIGKLHANSQAIRKQLNRALARGASAPEIFQIDVTAGYPDA